MEKKITDYIEGYVPEYNYSDSPFVDVSKINVGEELSVVSLFAGCGGMDLGFRGDFTVFNRYYEKNPFKIVFANELLEKACMTYEFNFKEKPVCGDIKNIPLSMIPKADVVIGGFPCQDFSHAGKRKGLTAERGRLYLEMKKVIDHCRPKAFIAENVDGIRTANGKEDFSALEVILRDFKESGYVVKYKVLNASHYGVPQNRVRVIIIGIRSDIQKEPLYPIAMYGPGKKKMMTAKEAIDDLWDKIDSPDFHNHSSKDYSRAKFYTGRHLQGNNRINADKPAPTIRSEHHGNIEGHYRSFDESNPADMSKWRRLSVRECARLQSFPDDFVFPVSSSDAYKEIGNAVPPILAWNIARAVYLSLK